MARGGNSQQRRPSGLIREKAAEELEGILARYPTRQAALMPTLFLAQQLYGHLSEEAMAETGEILGLSRTQVEAVVRFYTLYHLEPVGKYVIHLCSDLPCALRGAEALLDQLEAELGVEVGQTTEDGLFTLQTAMCVAACHRAPVMQVNLEYVEGLTPERLREVLAELRERAEDLEPALGQPGQPELARGGPASGEGEPPEGERSGG